MINFLKLIASEVIHKLHYNRAGGVDTQSVILNKLKIDGIYVIENFLDKETCKELLEESEKFIVTNPDKIISESNGSDLRVYGVDKYTSRLNVPKVLELSDSLFDKFSFVLKKSYFVLLGKITASEENLGSGAGWHRDSPFSHQFKTILYLSDVSPENGPFEFITKTHKFASIIKSARLLNKSLAERRFSDAEIEQLLNTHKISTAKTYPAKAGTLIIADTRALHRGTPLESGMRYALTRYHFSTKPRNNFFK